MIKRFVLRLVCFFLALCAVPAAYFCCVQSLPAMYRGSLMGSVLVKQETLRGTEGARILVVGGSSVPYAIECETVAEQTGMPCIALGATAYLGIEYYLSLLQGELHEGDIVVIAPEFTILENVVHISLFRSCACLNERFASMRESRWRSEQCMIFILSLP